MRRTEGGTVEEFDYVIVGAGSAGCVLANRLTEDDGVTVKLLEFGVADETAFQVGLSCGGTIRVFVEKVA